MRNIVLSVTLLVLLLAGLGSCRMRYQYGTPYRVWHVTGHTHRHWGSPRFFNGPDRFWRHKRFGPRPYRYRGHYRN